MAIHVTNMFKICASDYIIRTVLLWKMVFKEFPDYVIQKHHVTHSIFEVFGLQNPEKSVTPYLPYIKGKYHSGL